MKIAFYGSSLLSSYWNGAATYYRGLLRALAERGYSIIFCEPDAFNRQQNRDIDPPFWCDVVVYDATPDGLKGVMKYAAEADIVVKASGVGVMDDDILAMVMDAAHPQAIKIWWDVDAPATLADIHAGRQSLLRRMLPEIDAVLTYGGGMPVVESYRALGAPDCVPVYNALDPQTHYPVASDPAFETDLAFLGNRLPDREIRVEEFFLRPAEMLPEQRFLLGGAGWDDKARSRNVRYVGHVSTRDHNTFNVSPKAVLNITRESMAQTGFSPPTRVFEAAGAGACVITDAWRGIELFLKPDEEVLVARDAQDVCDILAGLTTERAREIGRRALARISGDHTYARRAVEVDRILNRIREEKRTEAMV
jgi:spore maturation protein CgeB